MTLARAAACVLGLCAVGAGVLAVPAAGDRKFPDKPTHKLSVSLVICFPTLAPANCGPSKPHGKHLTGGSIPSQAMHVGKITLLVPPSKQAKMTCPGRCGGFLASKTPVKISVTALQDADYGQYKVDKIVGCDSQDQKTCRFSLTRQMTINVVFSSAAVTDRRRN